MSRRMGALALSVVVAVGLSALVAGTAGARQSAAYKAAWIYVGPHNDGGWSQAHDDGRLVRAEGARHARSRRPTRRTCPRARRPRR